VILKLVKSDSASIASARRLSCRRPYYSRRGLQNSAGSKLAADPGTHDRRLLLRDMSDGERIEKDLSGNACSPQQMYSVRLPTGCRQPLGTDKHQQGKVQHVPAIGKAVRSYPVNT
jgi:hypothetical protein